MRVFSNSKTHSNFTGASDGQKRQSKYKTIKFYYIFEAHIGTLVFTCGILSNLSLFDYISCAPAF